jgi:hypothetical protein
MKSIKFTLLGILTLALAFFISCNDDNGEKLSGQMKFVTNTSGTIEANHMYLLTFSGLTGEQDIPNGVQIGANDEKSKCFFRQFDRHSVCIWRYS